MSAAHSYLLIKRAGSKEITDVLPSGFLQGLLNQLRLTGTNSSVFHLCIQKKKKCPCSKMLVLDVADRRQQHRKTLRNTEGILDVGLHRILERNVMVYLSYAYEK